MTEKQHSESGIITQFKTVVVDTENLLIKVSNVFDRVSITNESFNLFI